MTRMTLFNSPFFLGFDHFERLVDRLSKIPNEGYPPYNIEQVGDNGIRITLAVAGFGADDLNVIVEENQLSIIGKREDNTDRLYLHRGIATRQFQRTFVLAEGIEVENASFDNGLLHIDLMRPAPEIKAKRVEIKNLNNISNKSHMLSDQTKIRKEVEGEK